VKYAAVRMQFTALPTALQKALTVDYLRVRRLRNLVTPPFGHLP
jgi:hypothetical protein